MAPLLACIANISEGRHAGRLEEIRDAIDAVSGAWCLDVSADADHHRSVFSFVGDSGSIEDAALVACRGALSFVDLSVHHGVHPRVGAVDVVPFVPIEVPLEGCVAVAHRFGERLWRELGVPVYFYAEAALRPECGQLADLRPALIRGDAASRLAPDLGEGVHPTGGVTLVGARLPLIAFNVYLASDDLETARRIASRVRERGGGLAAVRALGFAIPARGQVQVSMNLLHYPTTSMLEAYRRVRREAKAAGVEPAGSELIGLAPAAALNEEIAREVELEDFGSHRILEERIREVVGRRPSAGGA